MADEVKRTDGELLRSMIHLSNNSQMTNEAAGLISKALSDEDLRTIKRWFQHAQREIDFNIQRARTWNSPKRGY